MTTYYSGGGGGRIALVSTGDDTSFSGSFTYPSGATNLTNFKAKVRALGGAPGSASTPGGGAGTIYLKHSGLTHGDLIVDNANMTYYAGTGSTELVSSVANSSIVASSVSSNTLQITPASAPFTNMVNLFAGALIHVFPTLASPDPYGVSHLSATLASNGANTFVATDNPFPVIAGDYYYRFVYRFDHVDIGGKAIVNLNGADLMLESSVVDACDLHSTVAGKFDVPVNSSITGNSIGSLNCLNAQVTTKNSTVYFTNYYLP